MNQPNRQQNKSPQPRNFKFFLGSRERYIHISSNFDSGNIKVVKQLSEFQYRLQCIQDGTLTSNPVNSKAWFYFKVKGFPRNTKGKFIVSKVQALSSIFYSKYNRCYRPVYRINEQKWLRFTNEVPLSLRDNGQLECTIQYCFKNQDEEVQFAFCYPYQFEQNILFLDKLNDLRDDNQIYFYKEVIVQSPEKRPIHLLTITSQEETDKEIQKEQLFNHSLFAQKCRPRKFKKPVVLITARVHPGQTPASYTMEGIINFLTNKHDLRAQLLRKMFVFMIIPMINVDGVFHGHFRMDIFGKNLNRFYTNPNRQHQPAIYAIKQLANYLIKDNRLSFYFDLHGHNAKKGCFIYGNAFNDFVQQVESQVFCKLFAMNHSGFEYEYCNFSQKHMNAKDRFEQLTKQGCGRVVMYKAANIIHSYSLQCGIISPNHANVIPEPINRDFTVGDKSFTYDTIQQNPNEGEKLSDGSVLFTEDSYRNLGKNLLVSILDVFDKNPYNRVYNSRYKTMEMLRRLTAFEIFHSAERFRMFQRFIFGKVKNINTLIQQILNNKIHYKQLYNCFFCDDRELKQVQWPKNILGFIKSVRVEAMKLKRFKSISDGKGILGQDQQNANGQMKSMKDIKGQRFLRDDSPQQSQKIIRMPQNSLKDVNFGSIKDQYSSRGQKNNNQSFNQGTQINLFNQNIKNNEGEFKNQFEANSDSSDVEQTEINQQILLMCEDQKQQNQIISKIMQNNFNQKDYEQIQQKFKHKFQQQELIEKASNISFSHTENTAKYSSHSQNKTKLSKDFSSAKQSTKQKYRLSKRLIGINTHQIYYIKHKPKRMPQISRDQTNPNTMEHSQEMMEIKKLTAAQEFRKNIYDSIKQQIKEGLRKQYERKKQKQKMDYKLIDSFRLKNQNTRQKLIQNLNEGKIKSKVRLPSLGSNMYIITTSTRLIHKT